MQTRSLIALAVLIVMISLMYFGKFLPEGTAGSDSPHPHEALACATCHSFGNVQSGMGDVTHISNACLSCHDVASSETSVFHGNSLDNDCAHCHSFHNTELLRAENDTTRLYLAKAAPELCLDCHLRQQTPSVSPGHRAAAELIHSQTSDRFLLNPSEFCLSCHDANSSVTFTTTGISNPPKFHTGASHAFGIDLIAGYRRPASTLKIQDTIPSSLVTIAGRIECQTCHRMTSSSEFLLAVSIEDGLCIGCHDMQVKSIVPFASASNF